MPLLKTHVKLETKARFHSIAEARRISEAELLRTMVLATTGQDVAQCDAPVANMAGNDRMTVRMPQLLIEAIKNRARQKSMAPASWIRALAQSNLSGNPVMTGAELAALQASARELAAIGRTINRITMASNAKITDAEPVPVKLLTALGAAVQENRAAIRALVRASQNAWEAGQ